MDIAHINMYERWIAENTNDKQSEVLETRLDTYRVSEYQRHICTRSIHIHTVPVPLHRRLRMKVIAAHSRRNLQ